MTMKADIDSLVADLKPVRPIRPATGTALAVAATLLAVAIVALVLGFRPDIMRLRPLPIVMLREGMLLILGFASLGAVVAAARPSVGRVGGDGSWIWALAAAALFPLTSLILMFAGMPVPSEARDPMEGMGCMTVSVIAALIVGAALTLWLRRGAPTAPARIGWLVGLSAGSFGTFAYGLRCMSSTVFYVGLWYTLAVAFCAVLGRLIVPRLIRW